MVGTPGIRQTLRSARRSLSARQQKQHATRCAALLGRQLAFLRARRVGCYLPADGEMDPRPLMTHAQQRGKTCYLPILEFRSKARRGGRLRFARYQSGSRTRPNRFGIPEPTTRGINLLGCRRLDLLIVPIVGFDANGHRIGMGGGFYDRTLAYLTRRRHWRRPKLAGVAHECQRLNSISPQPWDVPVDLIVTERSIITPPRRTRADALI